jgi:7SK snRNA methylphosphate capping enzyme
MEIESYSNDKRRVSLYNLVKNCRKGQFGNKLSYYKRMNYDVWNDPRISALHSGLINNKNILYIGSHNGTVPVQLALKFQPNYIEAIDIDEKLLFKAAELCKSIDHVSSMKRSDTQKILNELGLFKHDPLINALLSIKDVKNMQSISEKIVFKLRSILDLDDSYRGKKFNTIFCLNLTKYVHLNFGDEGILTLFQNVFELLEVGGSLVFQPQTIKSYLKIKSFAPIFSENFSKMKLQPSEFIDYLTENYSFEVKKVIEPECPGAISKGRSKESKPIYVLYKYANVAHN